MHTKVAVYDEDGALYFECEGETPGDIARELGQEMHELVEHVEGTDEYTIKITVNR